MLTNTNHRATDQRTGDSSDTTQHPTPLHRRPYWNQTIAAFSDSVWLPTGTADRGAAINRPHGWSSKTAAHSWFSTNRTTPLDPDLPRLYSPAAVQSTTNCSNQGATGQQSRRIQVYPDNAQKVTITTWLTASRWTYNLTAEILQSGIPAVWKHIASMVMAEVKTLHPEWDSVPYQVKRTAVRDACRAMSNVKTFNLELKSHQARGKRIDEEFAQLGYRSRQNPKQSCYIPDGAVTEHGVYHTILGPLRMAEAIPAEHKECRLVKEHGRYWLSVPYPAQCDIETPSGDGVVALDPRRSHLSHLLFRNRMRQARPPRLRPHPAALSLARQPHQPHCQGTQPTKASAQARMRQRITNLVDELHWQLARWLTSNYRIILLPTFETHDLTRRAGRRIRSKTARMMLTFRHYEFKQRLQWKAWQRGALVLDVNEAYTSKTRSWDGTVNTKLGGAKAIRDDTGFGMDRDVNGARGIFLRALGDSPFLHGLLTQVASQATASA